MALPAFAANGFTWIHAVNPPEEELRALQQAYGFHDLDIEDCLSENERPKIEEYPGYLFCVLHLPVKTGNRIVKEEVNVFVGSTFIVTLSEGKTDAISQLWKQMTEPGAATDGFTERGTGFFLYHLLDRLFDAGFPLIDGMMRELRRIEVELFEREESKVNILRDILALKRNIITMRSIIFPQRAVVALLQHKREEFIRSDLAMYFDDVTDAIERQWTLLDTARELSDALQETHESWLSHHTNTVVRVLTIFSVTMVPLTFLTSLYGMNVPLPFQDSAYAFDILLVIMVAVMMGLLGFFAYRKWL